MSNWNSIPGYSPGKIGEIQETLGITKFDRVNESKWAQVIGGLQIQGGIIESIGRVDFHAPYSKQVLGVFIGGAAATTVELTGFTSSATGYWFAIGV